MKNMRATVSIKILMAIKSKNSKTIVLWVYFRSDCQFTLEKPMFGNCRRTFHSLEPQKKGLLMLDR